MCACCKVWLACGHIAAAVQRVPAGLDAEVLVKALIQRTVRGDLCYEVDTVLTGNPQAGHQAITERLAEAFLGPDENNQLRDELKNMRPAGREEVPAYNR